METQNVGYLPVPVEAARQISVGWRKQIVVIVSIDHVFDKTHFTTYGQEPEDKMIAARLGEAICTATGHFIEQAEVSEDFRTVDAAKRQADIERLERVLVACDHALGSLLAVRGGMTDEALQHLRDQVKLALQTKP